MEVDLPVGYRFHPTDEELIDHYLKNKILGNSWLVDGVINDIKINDYEPMVLPSLSKIPSNYPAWYFFSQTVYKNPEKKTLRKRVIPSGKWKSTGKDRVVKDKNGNKIGMKKTLTYEKNEKEETRNIVNKIPEVKPKKKNKKSHWVMHEYKIISWSHPHQDSYVICKIMFNGDDDDDDDNNSAQSSVSNLNGLAMPMEEPVGLYMQKLFFQNWLNENNHNNNGQQLQTPNLAQDDKDEFVISTLLHVDPGEAKDFLSNQEFMMQHNGYYNPEVEKYMTDLEMLMMDKHIPTPVLTQYNDEFSNQEIIIQENCNEHKPKKPISGIITCYNSDAESISATSYEGTSSPGADSSIGRKNPKNRLTNRTIPLKQEAKQDLVKKEKKGFKKATKKGHKKTPQYVCLMNMIISFIILVAFIGNNISILSTVKT